MGRWAVLAAAVLGTALAYMSDDMLNLAIPSVARDLHASAPAVQWILNAYYIPLVAFGARGQAGGQQHGRRHHGRCEHHDQRRHCYSPRVVIKLTCVEDKARPRSPLGIK
jgi:MFS family permease